MTPEQTRKFCVLNDKTMNFLENVFNKLDFSARAYDKILRIARTAADLEGSKHIEIPHVALAVQYGSLDRKFR